jgi:hypothetical protein
LRQAQVPERAAVKRLVVNAAGVQTSEHAIASDFRLVRATFIVARFAGPATLDP